MRNVFVERDCREDFVKRRPLSFVRRRLCAVDNDSQLVLIVGGLFADDAALGADVEDDRGLGHIDAGQGAPALLEDLAEQLQSEAIDLFLGWVAAQTSVNEHVATIVANVDAMIAPELERLGGLTLAQDRRKSAAQLARGRRVAYLREEVVEVAVVLEQPERDARSLEGGMGRVLHCAQELEGCRAADVVEEAPQVIPLARRRPREVDPAYIEVGPAHIPGALAVVPGHRPRRVSIEYVGHEVGHGGAGLEEARQRRILTQVGSSCDGGRVILRYEADLVLLGQVKLEALDGRVVTVHAVAENPPESYRPLVLMRTSAGDADTAPSHAEIHLASWNSFTSSRSTPTGLTTTLARSWPL
jgi:hypothetical protein